ncbi:MAG TPA: 50S ribosomal protein L17 [Candidatus Paceibacterota bacterium]|nr:50S ribosomal protein L17 [Candidatus Paceibacterota bacterium]
MAYTKKAQTFHRTSGQRRSLMKSLSRSLILEERISTTEAKAKALRPVVERLVTYAKKNTLASRRLAKSRLGDDEAVAKLFATLGPRYADRKGGYTRIVKRAARGANDARKLAYIAFV